MRYAKMLAAVLATLTLGLLPTAGPALADTTPNGPVYCCTE